MEPSELLRRFGHLPFTLELELGSLEMTIGEIFELTEGSVFRTGHTTGTPFKLLTGGVQLAEAELVVLDGSVSVRVTNLSQVSKPGPGDDGTN